MKILPSTLVDGQKFNLPLGFSLIHASDLCC